MAVPVITMADGEQQAAEAGAAGAANKNKKKKRGKSSLYTVFMVT